MRRCYQCQKELMGKIIPEMEAECPHCRRPLRCCFNCKHHSPTRPKQCAKDIVQGVKDKTAGNTCTEFIFREFFPQTSQTSAEQAKKKIDDLFRNL